MVHIEEAIVDIDLLGQCKANVSQQLHTIFFFQAEDGIRDFCLSRGLGDVYKRQLIRRRGEIN